MQKLASLISAGYICCMSPNQQSISHCHLFLCFLFLFFFFFNRIISLRFFIIQYTLILKKMYQFLCIIIARTSKLNNEKKNVKYEIKPYLAIRWPTFFWDLIFHTKHKFEQKNVLSDLERNRLLLLLLLFLFATSSCCRGCRRRGFFFLLFDFRCCQRLICARRQLLLFGRCCLTEAANIQSNCIYHSLVIASTKHYPTSICCQIKMYSRA